MKLIHGDCLDVMKDIQDGSIDSIICDPPYGTTACKWDSIIPFDLMWEQLNRVIKDNGAIVLFGSEPFSSALRMSNIKNYKYDWVWDKIRPSNFLNAKKQPLRRHEDILIFYDKQCTYNRQFTEKAKKDQRPNERETRKKFKNKKSQEHTGRHLVGFSSDWDYTKTNPQSIISFLKGETKGSKFKHPTQKPIALMEYLIKTYTNEGETVLDFTMGSGSTGVACKNLGRLFTGIERDEKYFKMAEDRINNHVVNYKLF
jgi:site-specific DNA-methyltransferase (adenine-specific)